jgi:hypothetical protein
MTRELAAVDAALAGEPVDRDLAELAELSLLLRAERPKPRPGFTDDLDSLASRAFRPVDSPAEGKTAAPRERRFHRSFAHRRALPLAIGTVASMFIVVTAVLSSGVLSTSSSQDATPSPTPRSTPRVNGGTPSDARSAAPEAKVSPPALSAPTVPSAPTAIAPRAPGRKVERAASLTLAPPSDEVEKVADDVIRVTDRYQGFVLRSTVSGGESGSAGGSLDLRIPADRLQPAIRDLSALAHVRERTQNAEDVTGAYVSRRHRLDEALAERRALLRRLARALTTNETASIRARLRLANREIAAARRSLHALRERVSYARVTVAIAPDYSESGGGGSTLGDALDDARSILGTSLAVALVSLAVLMPLSIVFLGGWVAARRVVRGRRERALDDAIW